MTFTCPKRKEVMTSPVPPGVDTWIKEDLTCSFCGSLDPTYVMERLVQGTLKLIPTDSPDKVYVSDLGGKPLQHQVLDPKTQTEKMQQVTQMPLYFAHLDKEQQRQFTEMVQTRQVGLSYPGFFYVLPYFMAKDTLKP